MFSLLKNLSAISIVLGLMLYFGMMPPFEFIIPENPITAIPVHVPPYWAMFPIALIASLTMFVFDYTMRIARVPLPKTEQLLSLVKNLSIIGVVLLAVNYYGIVPLFEFTIPENSLISIRFFPTYWAVLPVALIIGLKVFILDNVLRLVGIGFSKTGQALDNFGAKFKGGSQPSDPH